MTNDFRPSLKKGIFLFLSSSFFYFIVRALGQHLQSHLEAEQILFMQNFVALLCLLPFFYNNPNPWQTSQRKVHLIRSCAATVSHYLCLLALKSMTLVDVTTLQFTSVFFIPLVSFFWFREKFTPLIWLTIAIGFSGMALILNPSWEFFQLGTLFVLGAGFSTAVGMSAARNLNLLQEPREKALLYVFTIGSLVTAGPCLMNWVSPTFNEWLLLIGAGLAVISNHALIIHAFKHAPASHLSPLAYSSIVYAVGFSWIVLKEPMESGTILGSLLIIFGGCLTYILTSKRQEMPSN